MVLATSWQESAFSSAPKGVIKELAYRRHFHGLSVGETPNHNQ